MGGATLLTEEDPGVRRWRLHQMSPAVWGLLDLLDLMSDALAQAGALSPGAVPSPGAIPPNAIRWAGDWLHLMTIQWGIVS